MQSINSWEKSHVISTLNYMWRCYIALFVKIDSTYLYSTSQNVYVFINLTQLFVCFLKVPVT